MAKIKKAGRKKRRNAQYFLVFGRFLGHLISIPNHKVKKKRPKTKAKRSNPSDIVNGTKISAKFLCNNFEETNPQASKEK